MFGASFTIKMKCHRLLGLVCTSILVAISALVFILNMFTEVYNTQLIFTTTEHKWFPCRGANIVINCAPNKDYQLFKKNESTSVRVGWALMISTLASALTFLIRYTCLWKKIEDWVTSDENGIDYTRWVNLAINQSIKYAFMCHMIGSMGVNDWVSNICIMALVRLYPIFVNNQNRLGNRILLVLTQLGVWGVPICKLATSYTWVNMGGIPVTVRAIIGVTSFHIFSIDLIQAFQINKYNRVGTHIAYDVSHTFFEFGVVFAYWFALFKI